MDYNAHLEGMSLQDVFQILSVGKMSGIATVIHDGHSGKIVFRRGQVVYASSDTKDRLGYTLVDKKIISEHDLTMALRDQYESDERVPLATLLVARGCVDSAELERQTMYHIRRVFSDMLSWRGGMVHFKRQEIPDRMAILREGLSTEGLLIRAMVLEDRGSAEEREIGIDRELCDFGSSQAESDEDQQDEAAERPDDVEADEAPTSFDAAETVWLAPPSEEVEVACAASGSITPESAD